MKKLSLIIAIAFILSLTLFIIPVLSAYSFTITAVTNSSWTTSSMSSVYASVDVDYLADNGYMTSTGLDTRVKYEGDTIPFMLADDRIAFANPLTTDSTYEFDVTTGNSALSNFDITIGEGGTITIADLYGLEPFSDPFELTLDGYIDTATPTSDTPILEKSGALELYVEGTDGTISVDINGTTELTATGVSSGEHEIVVGGYSVDDDQDLTTYTEYDPEGYLATTTSKVTFSEITPDDGTKLYEDFGVDFFDGDFIHDFDFMYNTGGDGSTILWMLSNVIGTQDELEDADEPYLCAKMLQYGLTNQYKFWVYESIGATTYAEDTSLYYMGTKRYARVKRIDDYGTYGRLNFYFVTTENSRDTEAELSEYINLHAKQDFRYLYWINSVSTDDVSSTAVSGYSEKQDIGVIPHVTLSVDDVDEDDAILEYAITNNSNDWILDWDTIKYLDYFDYEIDSTNKIHFQPDSIIYDDTLPNEDNPGTYDGTITWGTLSNILLSTDGITPTEDPLPPSTTDSTESDVRLDGNANDMLGETGQPDITGTQGDLSSNYFYPIVSFFHDQSGISISTIWYFFGMIFVILAMLGTAKVMPNHMLFILVSGFIVLLFLTVAMPIYPWWVLFIYVSLGTTFMVWERVPSV